MPLVTGALERGHYVRVLVRDPDKARRRAVGALLPAMQRQGATRRLLLTGAGVRVPRLTEGELRGRTRVAAHIGGDTGTTLGRADLAAFLLDELDRPTWSRQAPVVSW